MFSLIRLLFVVFVLVLFPLHAAAATYTDNFERADGPLTEWIQLTPTAQIQSGQLNLTATGGGGIALLGMGGQPVRFDDVNHIEFEIAYPGETAAWPYDHGGIIFCAQTLGGRYDTSACYVIDYLAAASNNSAQGRFRLSKFANGTEEPFTETAPEITSYEGLWEIDITDTTITFTFDGVEQFSWEDGSVRGGYIGFWCYSSPAENSMTVDNLSVDFEIGECPAFQQEQVVMTMESGVELLSVEIPFGANLTEDYEVTVTSRDTAVAAPVGHTDGSVTLTFQAGTHWVQNIEIEPLGIGRTEIVATVDGVECGDIACDVEVLKLFSFDENFAQADGPPEGWYIAADTAQVINEELSLSAPGNPFCWYAIGGEPVYVGKMESVRCNIKFAQAALPVGAHGGIVLAPEVTTARNKGYMIDVIERESDNGFRLYKDNNATVQLGGARQPYVWDDQWHEWTIEFTKTGFTFTVDGGDDPGEANVTVDDLSYRGGYLAFWCYTGASGQNVFVDNISIEYGASACPAISPSTADNRPVNQPTVFTVTAPYMANAESDFELTVTSSNPDVAVPAGAVDGALVLTFPQGGAMTQTFEAECLSPGTTEFRLTSDEASCADAFATFTVREPGERIFVDSFAQADGPPENWTIYSGPWQVSSEALTIEALPGQGYNEGWIWAGDPPIRIEDSKEITFTLNLTNPTADAVGAHGGVMFFADADNPDSPRDRWSMSGYEIDWIDRESDHGYRFLRADNGVHTLLAGPTFEEFPVLGTEWVIEIEGAVIRVIVDDELIFEVEDSTYREGHLGFWTYSNNTIGTVDNVYAAKLNKFKRGHINADDCVDISDAVFLLYYHFLNGPVPPCMDAADVNDDEVVDISDVVALLSYLFGNAGPLPEPFLSCGTDPKSEVELLRCEQFIFCD